MTTTNNIQIAAVDSEPLILRLFPMIFRSTNAASLTHTYEFKPYTTGESMLNDLSVGLIEPKLFITSMVLKGQLSGYSLIQKLNHLGRSEPIIIHAAFASLDQITYRGSLQFIQKGGQNNELVYAIRSHFEPNYYPPLPRPIFAIEP